MACLLVISNFPDFESAQAAANALVEKRLAACVNIIPGVTSIYRWEDKIEQASEVTALIKTTGEIFPKLQQHLLILHPYDVPEIVAIPLHGGHQKYLEWVAAESTGEL